MPSQYNEHLDILKYFAGRIGRFCDVGAYDGTTFSNTHCLMELGWTGVCIEPSAVVFPHLKENTKQFPGVECIEAAIVPDDFRGNKFWMTQDALSTLDPSRRDMAERHYANVAYQETTVRALKWQQFLWQHPGPYDFINIDVEGLNWEVLRDGPLAEMMCVELDPASDAHYMISHLRMFGLINQKQVGGNLLAWRNT